MAPRRCPDCLGTGKCAECDGSGNDGYDEDLPHRCESCSDPGVCEACAGTGACPPAREGEYADPREEKDDEPQAG